VSAGWLHVVGVVVYFTYSIQHSKLNSAASLQQQQDEVTTPLLNDDHNVDVSEL